MCSGQGGDIGEVLQAMIGEIEIDEVSLEGACDDLWQGLRDMEEFATNFTEEADVKDIVEHGLTACQPYNDAMRSLLSAMAKLRTLHNHNENHPKKPKLKLNKKEMEEAA